MKNANIDRNAIDNLSQVARATVTGLDLACEQTEALQDVVSGRELSADGYRVVISEMLGRLDFAQLAARQQAKLVTDLIDHDFVPLVVGGES